MGRRTNTGLAAGSSHWGVARENRWGDRMGFSGSVVVANRRGEPGVGTVVELVSTLLAKGHHPTFVVRGISMSPTLRDGDCVTLAPLPESGARRGDIVAFRRGPHLVLHRVLKADRIARGDLRYYLTAGDGLLEDDGVLREADVLGWVVSVATAGRTWAPQSLIRRVQGAARVFLSLHPRARRALQKHRDSLRLAAHSMRVRGRAGAPR